MTSRRQLYLIFLNKSWINNYDVELCCEIKNLKQAAKQDETEKAAAQIGLDPKMLIAQAALETGSVSWW